MTQTDFGALPYVPLKEQWITENPLFLSGDARLVRAAMKMLVAAWRGSPAGSLSPSYAYLADLTGLTEAEIGAHYEHLTRGWEIRGERLHHVEMSALCERLLQRHGETISIMAEDAVLAAQSPENFELGVGPAVESKNKGKRALRPSWRPSMDTIRDLAARGVTATEDIDFLVEKMRVWARGGAVKRADWDATLLQFADREPHTNLPSKRSAVVPFVGMPSSRFGGMVSRGDAAVHHNTDVFQRVRHGS
jgi:hypothetical protein